MNAFVRKRMIFFYRHFLNEPLGFKSSNRASEIIELQPREKGQIVNRRKLSEIFSMEVNNGQYCSQFLKNLRRAKNRLENPQKFLREWHISFQGNFITPLSRDAGRDLMGLQLLSDELHCRDSI